MCLAGACLISACYYNVFCGLMLCCLLYKNLVLFKACYNIMLNVYVIFGVLMLCLLTPPCLHTALNAPGREMRACVYTGRQKKEAVRRRFVFIRSR